MVAEFGGDAAVNHDRPAIGPWEMFVLADLTGGSLWDGDKIAFRTDDAVHYLQDQGTRGPMFAYATDQNELGASFILINLTRQNARVEPGDQIALRSTFTNWLVCAEGGGGPGSVVTVSRDAIGGWETFTIIRN